MSTKAIRDVLALVRTHAPKVSPLATMLDAADAELEAIRKAAKALTRLNVGDYTDDIHDRDHVINETPDGESTWNHPDVFAWSDASVLLATIAKEDGC